MTKHKKVKREETIEEEYESILYFTIRIVVEKKDEKKKRKHQEIEVLLFFI